MRHSLALLGSFLLMPVSAQIMIGPADMPSAGDTMRYFTTAATGIALAQTGADQVWDYGDLTALLPGADTAIAVTSTPFLYQFFFNNNFLYPDHAANYAMKGASFGVQGVSLEDVYDYYKKGPEGFRSVGFGATINGLPASVRKIPVDYIHRFPMEYGDQDTSYSAFNVEVPTIGYFGQTQYRYNHVDGWGTLILPSGTFEVLRVRSVLDKRDTLFIEQFGFGFGFNEPQTIEYKWIAQGMDAPVLIVTTVAGAPTTARFFHDPFLSTDDHRSVAAEPMLYPNPAHDAAFLHIPQGREGAMRVMDAIGREVVAARRVRYTIERIGLEGLAPGTYVVQVLGDGPAWSTRLVVH